jgi:hypothetical protein
MRSFLTQFFPDLAMFDIAPAPKKREEVKEAEIPVEQGEVVVGKKWKTDFHEGGFESDHIVSSKPGFRVKTLTGWDVGYLNEYHRNETEGHPTWKQALAEKLKVEWATEDESGEYPSAERVVRNHTAPGESEPQSGYGLSNVKKYFKAFNHAVKRELEEAKVKQGQK